MAMLLLPFQICQVNRWNDGAAAAQLRATEASALDKADGVFRLEAGRPQASIDVIKQAVVILPTVHGPLIFQAQPQWCLALLVNERVGECSIELFGCDCSGNQRDNFLFGKLVARQMQLLQVACSEQMSERRRVRDTILPEQEHARNVLMKKGLRQRSDGRIAERILRQIKTVQPNVHARVLRAQLRHDISQAIANIRNVLGRRKTPAGHINKDFYRLVATNNPHTISVHGDPRQNAEWASRPKLENQVVTTADASRTEVLTRPKSCVFNTPQLSNNSTCQQLLQSCLMKANKDSGGTPFRVERLTIAN